MSITATQSSPDACNGKTVRCVQTVSIFYWNQVATDRCLVSSAIKNTAFTCAALLKTGAVLSQSVKVCGAPRV
jgi:hypothetical protein